MRRKGLRTSVVRSSTRSGAFGIGPTRIGLDDKSAGAEPSKSSGS